LNNYWKIIMRQAIMVSPGMIEFREVPEPRHLSDNEILLEIKKIGICGSDIHVFHGNHPATNYPVVQGHEYSAIVRATGKNVTRVKPGMMATARPQLTCGVCGPCRRGQYNVCQNLKVEGFQAPGVAQDLFIVPEERIVRLPDSMSLEQGALIEPAAVGAHSTSRLPYLKGKNVVVSGAGTIGNLVAQFAAARGAAKVLITDISDYRLNVARDCGIKGILNVNRTPFEEGVRSFFGDEGFQAGFEAVGIQASLDVLMKYIEKGGDIVILGVYSKNPVVNMFYLGEHEINVFGSMMYLHEDYETAVEMIASGKILTSPLLTDSFPFNKYLEAYGFIEKMGERSMKVMIDL
jgi:2-desacetyl-2-hydroxyethyl bacteriochlorophyllide A dehydrogenase